MSITGNSGATNATVASDMPASSLRANEKYIIYNKHYNNGEDPENPEDPEGGDGGIFTSHYAIDVEVDPAWSGNNESQY